MDNKQYLEQISAEARPLTRASFFSGFNISPKLLKFLIGAIIVTILIFIIGAVVSSSNSSTTERTYLDQLYLRSNNITSVISKNNNLIKSSNLRSASSSFSALLSELNYNVGLYLSTALGVKAPNKPEDATLPNAENAHLEELNTALENARLTGTFDRTYARAMAYEINIITALEGSAIKKTKNENLKTFLTNSANNFSQLLTQFESFSGI